MTKFLDFGNQLVLLAVSVLGAVSIIPLTTTNQWVTTTCWVFAATSVLTIIVIVFGASASALLKGATKRQVEVRFPFSLAVQLFIVGVCLGILSSSSVSHQQLESLELTQGVVTDVYTTGYARRRSTYVVLRTAKDSFTFARPHKAKNVRIGNQISVRIFRQRPLMVKYTARWRKMRTEIWFPIRTFFALCGLANVNESLAVRSTTYV
ncbi:MAG: hypothetical protein AAFU85_27610, partial [Planctomycetota bacterium]